jgi:hypothetical protein
LKAWGDRSSPHAESPESGTLYLVAIPSWKAYLTISWACRTPFVLCLDKRYELPDAASIRRTAEAFPRWHYLPEVKDCDDAAFAFRAFAGHGVGIALSRKHAWNLALCTDGVWHIEPQTGAVRRKKRALMVII